MAGGKEVHKAVMSIIQDLATAFTSYEDEVLVQVHIYTCLYYTLVNVRLFYVNSCILISSISAGLN